MPTRGIHTQKEILTQSMAWRSAISEVRTNLEALRGFFNARPFSEAIFIGCGSTHYLSIAAALLFQRWTGVRSRFAPSSELLLFPDTYLSKGTDPVLIGISRSGETTETLRAVEAFQSRYPGRALGISCYADSSLMHMVSLGLVVRDGHEQSIAQTRSFAGMLVATQALTAVVVGDEEALEQLDGMAALGEALIPRACPIGDRLGGDNSLQHFFFLGSGSRYGLACEAMLKMKEMSLSYAEAYHFMEFRHGPKSMVNDQTLVIGLLSDQARDYEIPVLREMKALGGRIFVLTEERAGDAGEVADEILSFDSGFPEHLRGVLYLPALQWLAYARAMHKGLNPDSPRNLDAVVHL